MTLEPEFASLVEQHYRGLHWFALTLSRNAADAADLTQQTFLRWATKRSALRNPGSAKAWLFRTLYHEFLRQRRRTMREEPLPPELVDEAREDGFTRLDSTMALEALRALPAEFSAVVSLFYLRQLSYREIADVLEIPMGTVMSRLARGKAALRRALSRPPADSPAGPGADGAVLGAKP